MLSLAFLTTRFFTLVITVSVIIHHIHVHEIVVIHVHVHVHVHCIIHRFVYVSNQHYVVDFSFKKSHDYLVSSGAHGLI